MDHCEARTQLNRKEALLEDEGFILLTELRPLIPLHPQHIRKLVRRGQFPAPVRIGGRTAFRRREIREWMRQQE